MRIESDTDNETFICFLKDFTLRRISLMFKSFLYSLRSQSMDIIYSKPLKIFPLIFLFFNCVKHTFSLGFKVSINILVCIHLWLSFNWLEFRRYIRSSSLTQSSHSITPHHKLTVLSLGSYKFATLMFQCFIFNSGDLSLF